MSLEVISRIDYDDWLANEVTQRFMSEMRINHREAEAERIYGQTEVEIIKNAHARNESLTIFESILEWIPQELIKTNERTSND